MQALTYNGETFLKRNILTAYVLLCVYNDLEFYIYIHTFIAKIIFFFLPSI